jgi:hypothetical protein
MTQIFEHTLTHLTKSLLISVFHFDSNRRGLIEQVDLRPRPSHRAVALAACCSSVRSATAAPKTQSPAKQ